MLDKQTTKAGIVGMIGGAIASAAWFNLKT
jgi:hypothetical protein